MWYKPQHAQRFRFAQVSLLLSIYMRARRRRKALKQDVLAMLNDRLRDTARWSAFLGSFAGVFVTFDEGIAHAFGKARCCCGKTYLIWLAATIESRCSDEEDSTHAGLPTGERQQPARQPGPRCCSQGMLPELTSVAFRSAQLPPLPYCWAALAVETSVKADLAGRSLGTPAWHCTC